MFLSVLVICAALSLTSPISHAQTVVQAQQIVFIPIVYGPSSSQLSLTDQMAVQINQERSKHNCQPLSISAKLSNMAQSHSNDMAQRDFFAHTSPEGQRPRDRAQQVDYRYAMLAENIAAGTSDINVVIEMWLESPAHRANMLGCEFTEIGVGFSTNPNSSDIDYWTVNFGKPLP
jgi:uncharacterized protein YkwD